MPSFCKNKECVIVHRHTSQNRHSTMEPLACTSDWIDTGQLRLSNSFQMWIPPRTQSILLNPSIGSCWDYRFLTGPRVLRGLVQIDPRAKYWEHSGLAIKAILFSRDRLRYQSVLAQNQRFANRLIPGYSSKLALNFLNGIMGVKLKIDHNT